MTRVGDTSALYALFDEDDDFHPPAKAALEDPEPIAVPTEILVETVDLVAYRSTERLARRGLGWLLDRPNVRIADPVHMPAVREVHRDADGELSLADAFVIQTCRALGADPLAFDEAIRQRVSVDTG